MDSVFAMDTQETVKPPDMALLCLNASANTTLVETIVRSVALFSINSSGGRLSVVSEIFVKVCPLTDDFGLNLKLLFVFLKSVNVLVTRMSVITTKELPTRN